MSFFPRCRTHALSGAVLLVVLAGCKGGESLGPDKKVASVSISPKSAQLYTVGQEVAFSTVLTTEAGTTGEGIPITYVARDNSLLDVSATGVARALKKGGSTWVVASAGGKSDSALVEVPATTCGSVAARSLVTGDVATGVGEAGFCSAASSGDYTVIVHNNSLLSTGTGSIEITGVAIGTAPTSSGASMSRGVGSQPATIQAGRLPMRRDVAAEMQHRRAEWATMQPIMPAARAWYAGRSGRATRNAAVPAVGDPMTINVNTTGNGCTDTRRDVAARVAAVSNRAIVLADPSNPAGGYTDAEYAQFAATFDTAVYPLDVEQFGAPTDLDGNQRVMLVFTKAINERTASGSDSYVGGLTHSRDLSPKSGCPSSNEGEVFYLLVPDPSGTVNGNVFSKSFVTSVTDATITHEFQHLINFARRAYVIPGAQPREELWLNEGLSHIAEELLYYRLTGKQSRANIGFAEVFESQATFNQFAYYMAGDFINYDEYASLPSTTSPFGSGDNLATRGATWAFLRFAADQKLSADGSLWYNLVNSGQTGLTNLQGRLGIDEVGLKAMLRDFTIAVYADDYVFGVPARYTHLSWNMRSVYQGLQGYPAFNYPLAALSLRDGEKHAGSVIAGAFRLYRYKGLQGAESFIRVTGASGAALPSNITISIVRTQ